MIRADRASDYIRVEFRAARGDDFLRMRNMGVWLASSGGVFFALADPGGAGSTLGRGSCAGREMKGKTVVQET